MHSAATGARVSNREARKWRRDAPCAEVGGDLWFPEKGETHNARIAKKMCWEQCPVRQQCEDYAVANTVIHHGIWGGRTPQEIRRLRSERGVPDGAELPEDIEPEDESIYE